MNQKPQPNASGFRFVHMATNTGSPGGAHHGGATHSSGLTDLMLGTHLCVGIRYKSKYYRINHITRRLSNRISTSFQPSPPSFLYITLYVAVAPPFPLKLPLFYLAIAALPPKLPLSYHAVAALPHKLPLSYYVFANSPARHSLGPIYRP